MTVAVRWCTSYWGPFNLLLPARLNSINQTLSSLTSYHGPGDFVVVFQQFFLLHDMICKLCMDHIVLLTATDAIEAEAVLFNHPVMLTLPTVIGCRISGNVSSFCCSTDIVLAITKVQCCRPHLPHTFVSYTKKRLIFPCRNWPSNAPHYLAMSLLWKNCKSYPFLTLQM